MMSINYSASLITCILCLIFSLNYCVAQSKISLPNDIYQSLYQYPEEEVVDRYNRVKKYNYEDLTQASKCRYDLTSTVYNVYVGNESPKKYLYRALEVSKKGVCRLLVSGEKNFKYRIERGDITSEENWFLLDMPDFNADSLLSECKIYLDSLKSLGKEEPIIMSNIIRTIQERDRKYRSEIDINWNLQNRADSINRVTVDSLYNAAGSLKSFSKDEIDIFSLVLHHSNDCEWIMKWTEIFFDEKDKNDIFGAYLLGPAINRMYKKEDGYCYILNPEKVQKFIMQLKEKYPKLSSIYLKDL